MHFRPPSPPVSGRRNLICALDWGLGHASRCLALADGLEAAGESVIFASSGPAAAFLRRERPTAIVHTLPSYRVTYPSRWMPLNVVRQLPRWLRVIYQENRELARLVRQERIDRIISDNRFGCYHHVVPSVFLTHQLHPITHEYVVARLYRAYLQRYDEFWVPDWPDRRLSGQLSRPAGYAPVHYLGPLSRLPPQSETESASFDVLALLSGPEPQRSWLEQVVLDQLDSRPGHHVLVRGLPAGGPPLRPPAGVTVHDFADAGRLARLLPAAGRVVCRSGYSTLMDVHAVTDPQKMILIPTPGQTEQIYLARRQTEQTGCRWLANARDLRL